MLKSMRKRSLEWQESAIFSVLISVRGDGLATDHVVRVRLDILIAEIFGNDF